nr:uncharacterized protein LOC129421344 isoform X3 [Misgurnus anguillicaudatus]XP_055032777.1 uncharacterized protein LOC129421344 isoform X3 [Misgurnus anguillicaudatus]
MMGAVNVVLLVLLVWTFTAVCEADDDDIIINCEDVAGTVGHEINLTCTVSYPNQNCYMTMYKFTDTAADDICKEQFSKDLLKQERSFSCPYTADKAMKTKFKFHLQSTCGAKTKEFSVSTPDIIIKCEDVTAYVGHEINLACNVSHLNQNCYTTMYKFTDTAAGDICKEQFSKDLLNQESRVSCPYTADKPMTTKFKFFLQTTCGQRTTDFSLSTSDITIKCEDVTAHVGDEINLACAVSYLKEGCCVKMYKFIDTVAADDDPTICREDFRRDSCKQELRYSCTYTANKTMTATLKLFLQTNCGSHTKLFTANVAGAVKDETGKSSDEPPVQTTDKTTIAVIICLLICFVIVAVALFLWKRRKTSRSPQDYNMAARENNISEPSDEEAVLKETSVNAQTVSTASHQPNIYESLIVW